MVSIKEYRMVDSIEEAYELNQKKSNVIIAGMGWIKMQKKSINVAIDMSKLALDKIEEDDNSFKIGAMVTLRDLETHKGINQFFGNGIKESLCHIVGVQFRNCATVGGSIRMKFGFSDILTSLMALDADVETFKKGIIPLVEYAQMPYDRDILMNIILKKEMKKMEYLSMRNSFSDLPVLTVAVCKTKGSYSAVVGSRPSRAEMVKDEENILVDGVTAESIKKFAEYITNTLDFHSNTRASKAYREHISRVLIKRCVTALNGGTEQ